MTEQPDLKTLVSQIDEAKLHERFEDALELARTAAATYPNHVSVRVQVARLLVTLNRHEEAIESLSDAVVAFPDSAAIPLEKSRIAFELGDHARALEFCKRAVELQPDHFSAWCELAKIYRELGQLERAIECAEAASELDPQHAGALHSLGRLLQSAERHEDAIAAARRMKMLRPNDVKATELMAQSYASIARELYRQRQYAEVAGVCREATKDGAESERLLVFYTQSLVALHQFAEAESPLCKLSQLRPDDGRVWLNLARTHSGNGHWEEAFNAWQRVTELNPTSVESWHSLLRLHIFLRRYDELPEAFERAEKMFEGSADGHLELAELATRAELDALAIKHFQLATEPECEDHAVPYRAGCIKFDDGRISDALAYFERAFNLVGQAGVAAADRESIDEKRTACQQLVLELSDVADDGGVLIPEDVVRYFMRHPVKEYDPVAGKVMLFSQGLAAGGAERQVVNTIKGLLQVGGPIQEVVLVCKADQQIDDGEFFYLDDLANLPFRMLSLAEASESDNIRCIEALGEKWQLVRHLPAAMRADLLRLYDQILKERPVVVHAWQDRHNVTAGLAMMLAGVPRTIFSARNVPPNNPLRYKPGLRYLKAAYQALMKDDRCQLAHNSRQGAVDYGQWLECDDTRFPVVHNGVDFAAIDQTVSTSTPLSDFLDELPQVSGPVIGSVFRLTPQKRPQLWLETARLVMEKRPDVSFVIVGDGPLRNELLAMAKQFGIEDRFFLPGRSARVGAWYEWMDMFLLTSAIEGLPNVIIEALGMGVPCVTTNAGGASEIVVDGRSGWVVDQAQPAELADKLLWCLSHQDWMQQASAIGKADVRQRFSIDAMITGTMSLYGIDTH